MKMKQVKGLFQRTSAKVGSVILATALVFGTSMWALNSRDAGVPELVTFVDSEGSIVIPEEEVPLGAPKVTTSTKTKKQTKKIKMKKAATKSYKKQGKTTTKKQTKTSKSGSSTTTTETVTATTVVNSYVKGSDINTQETTTKTTVTKTVVSTQSASASGTLPAASGSVSISSIAPKVDGRVSSAFSKLGFGIKINSGVSYSGVFDARSQGITLKRADDTVYHELGHFVGFIAGNVDRTSQFQAIYNSEKSKYTMYNKAYVLSSPSEYFAESFKNYTLDPGALRASRPQTYAAIQSALANITDAQVSRIWNVYKVIWA